MRSLGRSRTGRLQQADSCTYRNPAATWKVWRNHACTRTQLSNCKKFTHRIASEPSLRRNDAQRDVHQAGASLPFDKIAAGNFRAQGQKLSIVF